MPEGDTIFRTAQALHRALAAGTVTRFETAYAHLARVDTDRPIVGRTIESVTAHGKHLLIRFSGDLVLRTHMRMSGRWHVYRPGERWRAPARAVRIVIGTAAAVAIALDVVDAGFIDGRRLARVAPLADLGPDLLAERFDEGDAAARLRACGAREIGEVLLDQRVLAGAGNVFKSEVLFVCGVHPRWHAGALTDDQARAIVRTARRLLRANVAAPPATAGAMRRTTGRLNPAERLWVYGRRGRPCRRCGSPIASDKQGVAARSTFWCPRCQPPTNAGRPLTPPPRPG